jgi:hypothetical protein
MDLFQILRFVFHILPITEKCERQEVKCVSSNHFPSLYLCNIKQQNKEKMNMKQVIFIGGSYNWSIGKCRGTE